jgi:hypothetical protein
MVCVQPRRAVFPEVHRVHRKTSAKENAKRSNNDVPLPFVDDMRSQPLNHKFLMSTTPQITRFKEPRTDSRVRASQD